MFLDLWQMRWCKIQAKGKIIFKTPGRQRNEWLALTGWDTFVKSGSLLMFVESSWRECKAFPCRLSYKAANVTLSNRHIADSGNWVSGMLIMNFITINLLLQLCNCKTANRIKSSLRTIAQHQFVTTFHSWSLRLYILVCDKVNCITGAEPASHQPNINKYSRAADAGKVQAKSKLL